MSLRSRIAIGAGSVVSWGIRLLKLGSGITWAGEIALRIDPSLVSVLPSLVDEIIIVAGTNGKTTTASMISYIVENNNYTVIHNATGANLKNGITGTFITHKYSRKKDKKCIAVLEVDEAEFTNIVPLLSPKTVVLLNLFRDQLDRYGEVHVIADKWKKALSLLSADTQYVANADDPLIATIMQHVTGTVSFFGLQGTQGRGAVSHAADSSYCPVCGSRLKYKTVYLSHFGDWYCSSCKNKRPKLTRHQVTNPLIGRYNYYNALAAVLTAEAMNISYREDMLNGFKPAFGRQEVFALHDTPIQMFLSKNPTGFNESIYTILEQHDFDVVVLALNDRIPDGTDVSWIWDVDFEMLSAQDKMIICTGDRVYDMGLRMQYESGSLEHIRVEPDLKKALETGVKNTTTGKKLYVLPTYSAMLDMRKVLTGRKIT